NSGNLEIMRGRWRYWSLRPERPASLRENSRPDRNGKPFCGQARISKNGGVRGVSITPAAKLLTYPKRQRGHSSLALRVRVRLFLGGVICRLGPTNIKGETT